MCDQQSLRSACAYAQSHQSLCLSLDYSIRVKLQKEQHLEFLSLKGGCTGLSESTLAKTPSIYVINKGYFSEAFLFKPRGGPTERLKQKAEEKSFI